MSQYRPYPEYKSSGLEWMGRVPKQWEITRSDVKLLSNVIQISKELMAGKEVHHYSIPVVQETGAGEYEDGSNIDSSKLIIIKPMLLISKLNPRKNTVCYAKPHNVMTVCSSEFVPVQPLGENSLQYFLYLFFSETMRQRLNSMVESATKSHQRVKPEYIRKFWWAWPSPVEQEGIASFLDRETARIDAFIEKKQRLIELLQEKRQAVITQAVTKGLDPSVPMKDSGIEWMGLVPEHWVISRVGYEFVNLDSRRIPLNAEERGERQGEYPYYGASGIIDYIDDFLFDEDLILVGEDGANLLMRSTPIAFIAQGKYWVNNHAHILNPIRDNQLNFWVHVLECIDYTIYITGAAQPKLTAESLNSIPIVYPPDQNERATIEKYIVKADTDFNQLIEKVEKSVKLIQ